MAKVTIVSRLFEAAETLLRQRPKSETFRRRAVSTAYYAVFHQVATVCADCLLGSIDQNEDNYQRIYRALDHGTLKQAFLRAPLAGHTTLREIGDVIQKLQSERHRADYLPQSTTLFPMETARHLLDQALQIADDLAGLSDDDRRTLAICLLFKSR